MIRQRRVSFTSNNQKIVGTLLLPELKTEKPLPGVVFYHGRGSSQRNYLARAEAVVEKGIICLTFDFRGRGESEGEFSNLTIRDGINDALAAFDFLAQQRQVDKSRLGICGRSYGGYLAVLVSERRNVKSLVLSAPAIYKDSWTGMACKEIPIEEVKDFRIASDFGQSRAIKAIKKFRGSLYVIVNEKDEVIPGAVVRAYYDCAISAKHKEITFIKGAGHLLDRPEFDEQFKALTAEWFVKTL